VKIKEKGQCKEYGAMLENVLNALRNKREEDGKLREKLPIL